MSMLWYFNYVKNKLLRNNKQLVLLKPYDKGTK
ncbi:MAG: hypothetical protein ACI8SC_002087 [Colwellia sp.]|jgi:hypothetical protein